MATNLFSTSSPVIDHESVLFKEIAREIFLMGYIILRHSDTTFDSFDIID